MIRRIAVVLLLFAAAAFAEAPSAEWRTMRTAHFRVHYPLQYEAWAQHAAVRLESVRDAVVKEVGFDPPQTTDVIVENPRAYANGETIPLLDTPRIVLWTDPPEPESQIGEFREWIELLEVHEMTHLVHLLRPSRNPMKRLLEKVVPVNPIATSAPRWVLEGYATVVEGRITGSGRPGSVFRAAVLRKWAASGRMPTYGELAGNRRFMGMSMAYLAGSAFLEWLEQRTGPGSLHALWARMTARQTRSFAQAFEGVFGDRPERLYGKYVAELTASATRPETLREGELWQETSQASREPAVSPDGKELVIVLRDAKRHAKLVVWPTGPNPEETKFEERIAKVLKRDPQDVAPLRAKPLPREPLHSYEPLDGGDVETPRWTRDGKSIVFMHRQPDRDGVRHRDLFRWWPESGRVDRLTHLGDVSDADPLPDGKRAVAVRTRFGFSQIVYVDLTTGDVQPVTEPSLERVVAHPRASAGGELAWTEHSVDGWQIVRAGRVVERGFSPEWTASGDLVGVVDFDIAQIGAGFVTRSGGAALDPAPAPDGSLFFMSLEPDGFVVRKLGVGQALLPVPPERTAENRGRTLSTQPVPASHPYGLGRQELGVFFGGQYTAHERHSEVGVRMGDVIGRLDVLAIAGDGAALAAVYRGLPVDVGVHLFNHGAELRGTWKATFPLAETQWRAGTLACRSEDRQECLSSTFFGGSFSTHQRDIAEEAVSVAADSKRHVQATLDARFKWLRVTATDAHRVTLGGVATSIEPESLFIARILDPSLPRDFTFAEHYRGARVAFVSGPVELFAQRHHAGRNLDVVGIEASLWREPTPLVKAAGFDITAGVARVRQERATRGWLALRWRP